MIRAEADGVKTLGAEPGADRAWSGGCRGKGLAARDGSISGTGLGLWLSQKLAERLGTRIHLSLEAGQVVFWFTLPLLSGVPSAAVPPGCTRSVHAACVRAAAATSC